MRPKPDLLDYVGHTLEVLRRMRQLSQAEFAEKADIRPNQVSRYEIGHVLPQLAQLDRLTAALGLDVGQFFFFVRMVQRIHELLVMLDSPGVPADPDREWQDLQEDREAQRLWIADRVTEVMAETVRAADGASKDSPGREGAAPAVVSGEGAAGEKAAGDPTSRA